GVDQHGEACDQTHDDLAAHDNDRDAGDEPEHDKHETSFRRCRDAYDVVETHDEVGDDDRPYRGHQAVAGLDLVVPAVLLSDQLDPDPEQQCTADQLEPGIAEQGH